MDHYSDLSTYFDALAKGETNAEALQGICQARIQAVEPKVRGFIRHFETPYSESSDLQGPWQGVPIVLKDNICLKHFPTTCASRILENFVSPYHATVAEKLLKTGLAILGKANLDEFAMGSSNENSAFHLTYNPWDLTRVPGGSSGGSIALVAAGETPLSLGSDTGGSIRLPAAFCGVVGMKPTYGRVSRYGLVAYASSLDQIGPVSRSVRDNALLLNLIAGHDPHDSTSLKLDPEDFTRELGQPIAGMKIGVPHQMVAEGLEPEVKTSFDKALSVLAEQGAEIIEVDLPHLPYALAAYYIIATSEASSNLSRYDGVRYGYRAEGANTLDEMFTRTRTEGFGHEVKLRIMLGTFALSSGYYDAYYKKAQQVRTLLIQEFRSAFEKVDILASPTAPMTAFKLGEKQTDPLSMYLADILTVPANLAGLPALSLPCGFDSQNLPIGLQLMAEPLAEARVYKVAHAYESATPWHQKHPVL